MPVADVLQPARKLLRGLLTVRPRDTRVTIGLDVGSTSVKAVALGPRKRLGSRPMIGQHLGRVNREPPDDVVEALKASMSALQLPAKTVNLSVSGSGAMIRIVELPAMKPAELKQALPFEAQRYLPFSLQDVVLDGLALGPSEANKMWVLLVACKKDLIEQRLEWARKAGVGIGVLDVDALALANSFLASENGAQAPDSIRALIHVGAQWTDIVIVRAQTPYLVRDIPWGGDRLMQGIAVQAGGDAARVHEAFLKNQLSPDMLSAMRVALDPLIAELQLSFDYLENRFGRPPEELFVSGGIGQSAGFIETLKGHLTQTVRPWVPAKGLSGQFAIAYGLALRAS